MQILGRANRKIKGQRMMVNKDCPICDQSIIVGDYIALIPHKYETADTLEYGHTFCVVWKHGKENLKLFVPWDNSELESCEPSESGALIEIAMEKIKRGMDPREMERR